MFMLLVWIDQLHEIEKTLLHLQEQHIESTKKSDELSKSYEESCLRIENVEKFFVNLIDEKNRWEKYVNNNERIKKCIYGESILSSFFLVYTGLLNYEDRKYLIYDTCTKLLIKNHISVNTNFNVVDYFIDPIQSLEFNTNFISNDNYMKENCILIYNNFIATLIIDRSTEPLYNIEYFLSNKFEKISQYLLSNSIFIHKNIKEQQKNNSTPKNKRNQQGNISNKDGNIINETNYLTKIDELINIFKMIKKKQLLKLCSGPGCVTKSQDITRQDDKQYFFVGTNIEKENKTNTINNNNNNKRNNCSNLQKNSKYFNNNDYIKKNNNKSNNIHSDNDCSIDISNCTKENKQTNHCKNEYIQDLPQMAPPSFSV